MNELTLEDELDLVTEDRFPPLEAGQRRVFDSYEAAPLPSRGWRLAIVEDPRGPMQRFARSMPCEVWIATIRDDPDQEDVARRSVALSLTVTPGHPPALRVLRRAVKRFNRDLELFDRATNNRQTLLNRLLRWWL